MYDIVFRYNLITSSPEEKKMFKVLKFHYVIFDEAHMLKNMKTARYEHLSQINVSMNNLLGPNGHVYFTINNNKNSNNFVFD